MMTTLRRSLAVVTAVLWIGSPAWAAGPRLWLERNAATLEPGMSFQVFLKGEGFGETAGGQTIENVTGGQKFSLDVDPAVLQFLSIDIDARWNFAPAKKPGVYAAATGTLSGVAFGSFPAVTDDAFGIATLTFRALTAGDTAITLMGGEMVGRVAGTSGTLINTTMEPLNVQIAAIPEPGTWALALAGLGILGLRRRR